MIRHHLVILAIGLSLSISFSQTIMAETQPQEKHPAESEAQVDPAAAADPKNPARSSESGSQGKDESETNPVDPDSGPKSELGDDKNTKLVKWSDDEMKQLLGSRLDGEMGMTFGQFGKLFLVNSRLNLGVGISLLADDKGIVRSELQSPFPRSYRPTLREFLDAIAVQTFSEWKYDPSDKRVEIEVETKEPIKDLVIFAFEKAKRKKPFHIALVEDWKAEDKGNWVMYIPPEFPVGMDIYEMGRYSTDDEDKKSFYESIRRDVALEWARRVNPDTAVEDLQIAHVGPYEALHYDKLLKGNGKKIRWRQWVFRVEDRCYFIVSTIIPGLDDLIYPDVQSMLESFSIEKSVSE